MPLDRLLDLDDDSEAASESYIALIEGFTEHWRNGTNPRAEDYLERVPGGNPMLAVELIYHEFCLAETSGLQPDPAAYLRRFPDYQERLARLFHLHEVLTPVCMDPTGPGVELPTSGDEIGPYRLCRELGKGSFARVFLAEQSDLEDRFVVVKVATRPTLEPRLLARARHPNIVEVLRQAHTDDGTLHLVCMPFLGGATLAAVLDERTRVGRRPRTGLDLLALLDRVSAPEYRIITPSQPAREILSRLSYSKAVAWIVARLADALDHAHRRGIVHGDVKPSNILLSADAQPMLFDFNLALDWQMRVDPDVTSETGGTLAYMAPEQLRAFAHPELAFPFQPAATRRSDVYGLGLVLAELLNGKMSPLPALSTRALRGLADELAVARTDKGPFLGQILRSTPRGLRPILRRCLAADPADRYAHASELAADLDRAREDRALAYADVPSWPARLEQSCRRGRSTLVVTGLILLTGLSVALGLVRANRMSLRDLAVAKLDALWNGSEPDVYAIRRTGLYRDDTPEKLAEAAQRHLIRYHVLDTPDWRLSNEVRYLPDAERADLELWILEQAYRLAWTLSNRSDADRDWERAFRVLESASNSSFPGPFADLAVNLRSKLGRPGPVTAKVPPPAVEEYLRGVEAEISHDRRAALRRYQRASAAAPNSFWCDFRAGLLARQCHEYATARSHLEACVLRRPQNPLLRVTLAIVLYYQNDYTPALEQINQALTLNPDLAEAYHTLLYLRQGMGQAELLKADFNRYKTLESAHPERGEHNAILEALNLFRSQALQPSIVTASESRNLGLHATMDADASVVEAACYFHQNDMASAIDAYRQALTLDPGHMWAKFGYANLLDRTNHPDSIEASLDLVNDGQFAEFLADNEEAVLSYLWLGNKLIQRGQSGEALTLLRKGLDQLDHIPAWNEPDRTDKRRDLRGRFEYLSARAYAVDARTQIEWLNAAIEHLVRASRLIPAETRLVFAQDEAMEPFRSQLAPCLDPDGTTR